MKSPIAIIAGNGRLPLEVASSLIASGNDPLLIEIGGQADTEIEKFSHERLEWGQIGKLFKLLKSNHVKQVVFAGGIVGRPELQLSKLDLGAVLTLPTIISTLLAGDNEILSGVISIFEKRGFEVLSLADLLPSLTVAAGNNTRTKAKAAEVKRIDVGRQLIAALAPFDVGQACVVIGKRAVAVEGVEGTDHMLERIVKMRDLGRLPARPCGVLIKALKLGQDQRADLPTIGPDTVRNIKRAGLLGVALEAKKTLIVDRETTLNLAEENKLFVHGFANANA